MPKTILSQLNKLYNYLTWRAISAKLNLSVYQVYRIRKFNSKPRTIDITKPKFQKQIDRFVVRTEKKALEFKPEKYVKLPTRKEEKKGKEEKKEKEETKHIKLERKLGRERKLLVKEKSEFQEYTRKQLEDRYGEIYFEKTLTVFSREYGVNLLDIDEEFNKKAVYSIYPLFANDIRRLLNFSKPRSLDTLYFDFRFSISGKYFNVETGKVKKYHREIRRGGYPLKIKAYYPPYNPSLTLYDSWNLRYIPAVQSIIDEVYYPAVVNNETKVWGSLLKDILSKGEMIEIITIMIRLEKIEMKVFAITEKQRKHV